MSSTTNPTSSNPFVSVSRCSGATSMSSGRARARLRWTSSSESIPTSCCWTSGLPGIDGYEVLRQIRAFSDVPVVMLTARDDAMDKVKGLELGADDYVTKPFNHLELMARVKAVLRRLEMPAPTSRAPSFKSGDLEVDFAKQEARLDGNRLDLTPTEYKLLYHLVRNAGHILEHGTLLAKVWGREYVDEVDYIRVYIRRLRDKLGDSSDAPRYIQTERGLGYRFIAPS